MKGIKLKNNGSYHYIVSPSGKRITAKRLEVGKTYLHQDLRSLRTITEMTSTHVYYEQRHRLGCCSHQHFAALCPHEATEEEIQFLTAIEKPHKEDFLANNNF